MCLIFIVNRSTCIRFCVCVKFACQDFRNYEIKKFLYFFKTKTFTTNTASIDYDFSKFS